MSNQKSAVETSSHAINSMPLIGNFKELFDESLKIVRNNQNMETLVENVWTQTQKRYPGQRGKDIAQYPALLSSVILVANHYDVLKDMDRNHLSALSYATYYLTNGVTTDMVSLFGDDVLIDKIIKKVETRGIDNYSKNYYTLNAMGNFLNEYNNLNPTYSSEQIKQYLNNYIDTLTPEQLKHLEPMYKVSAEDINIAYNLLFSSNGTNQTEGENKRENRRL